jgi:hypothetical protein
MRILVLLGALLLAPVAASAQTQRSFVEGFGGLRTTTLPAVAGSLGGTLGVSLTPGIQAVGEVGRISDVMPSMFANVLDATPIDLHVSALYGEGGVRFVTNPRGHVSGYGEALGGVTRLNTTFGGVGSPTTDALVNIGLRFLDTTDPIAGVGGGVIVQGGPVVATIGYRFNRVFASDSVAGLLASGGNLDVNELRVGFGFRF